MYKKLIVLLLSLFVCFGACKKEKQGNNGQNHDRIFYHPDQMVMGADLSYLNQIMDHGGIYIDSGMVEDPYIIFRKYGSNVIRFRLFHTPAWTMDVYDPPGAQMYHDYQDVKMGIQKARAQGMQVCLDFHYSDNWADPGKQGPPEAWLNLTLEELHDSIYNYTLNILSNLDDAGLMPEFVQVGNEINPGFVLPQGNRWDGNEPHFVYLLNAAIRAVRDAEAEANQPVKIIIHVAQPENIYTWFEGLDDYGLTDYDIIGMSYYYMWSSVPLNNLDVYITNLRNVYGKDILVMETIYPWTTENADDYPNIINPDKLSSHFPATPEGQFLYYKALTQEIIDGGGAGLFLWEPGWITSDMRTQWGQGSAWDCNTLFDFDGNTLPAMDFMTHPYEFGN